MLYIKREINESIDEHVIDEDNILDLIERVLGSEFRAKVESSIGGKDKIKMLEDEIECGDRQYNELATELENATEEILTYESEFADFEKHIEELEETNKELEEAIEQLQ